MSNSSDKKQEKRQLKKIKFLGLHTTKLKKTYYEMLEEESHGGKIPKKRKFKNGGNANPSSSCTPVRVVVALPYPQF